MTEGSLSRYRVLQKLGGGGMGVVYKAEDTRLKRTVALKFLPEEVGQNTSSKERFLREARAAAVLDHPNIAVVHDVGESPDGMYIAMAYYPGESIKKKTERGPLPIEEALELGRQIAEGLAAAHAGEIIHRDIKPANVMVTREGQAKIVDFGLAKLSGEVTLTRAGANVGTVVYMSPEQVRGERVDQRTDLWSLGVVLYEMLTGERPFGGETEVTAINSILSDAPTPLLKARPGCPELVEDLVLALLSKDREDRPTTAAVVAQRLSDLKFSLDSTKQMTDFKRFRKKESAWQRAGRRSHPWKAIALGTAMLGLVTWTIVTLLGGSRTPPIPVGRPLQVTDFTGWESDSAISSDGGLIAFTSNQSGSADIWIVDAKGGNPLQLTKSPADDRKPSWFPDGSALAYVSDRSGESAIWKVPRLGGSSTMLLLDATDPAVSPDGSSMAFAQIIPGGDTRIAVADLDHPQSPSILTGPEDGLWSHTGPAWSPDGKWICYSDNYNLWLVHATGGEAQQLTADAAGDLEPVWSPDGRFIYFSSYRDGALALWRIRNKGGPPQRLTAGTGPERHPSLSRDGERLAYDTFIDDSNIVLVNLETGQESVVSGPRSESGPTLAPDGSALAFDSDRWAGYNLWLQSLDGPRPVGEPRRINDEEPASSNAEFSPNGEWIAYQRRDGTEREVWVVAATGGVPTRFTTGPGIETHPTWSPDGSAIAYVSYREGRSDLWFAPFKDGQAAGPPTQIRTTVEMMLHPDWSDDSESIVYIGSVDETFDIWQSWIADDREPRQLTFGADPYYVRWRPGAPSVLVSGHWEVEQLSIREVDVASGEIMPFNPPIEFGTDSAGGDFDIDARGRLLAFTREEVRGDVWLMEAETGSY